MVGGDIPNELLGDSRHFLLKFPFFHRELAYLWEAISMGATAVPLLKVGALGTSTREAEGEGRTRGVIPQSGIMISF